jgi:hypothetical protein
MSAALIAQLLATFGPSAITLITTLITKVEANGTVSAAEWSTLTASVQQTAKQRMALALTSAGIDPTSPQGVALLAAAS